MFKTEMHLHTKEVSLCAHVTAADMIARYHELGVSTVCVTDHYQSNTFGAMGDILWEEKADAFMRGYEEAKKAGDALGVCVLFGAEMAFASHPHRHYLVYGITREFLTEHPALHLGSLEDFRAMTKDMGVLIVQAHPYRDGKDLPTEDLIDGVEALNANPRHDDRNHLAEAFALSHGLCVTGGSDAHREEDIAYAGIETEEKIDSMDALIDALKNSLAHPYVREREV